MDMIMDTIQENGETGLFKPLFEARLQYQSDMEAVVNALWAGGAEAMAIKLRLEAARDMRETTH